MRPRILPVLVLLAPLMMVAALVAADELPLTKLALEVVPLPLTPASVEKVVAIEDRLYVLDTSGHQLLLITGETFRRFGGIGNGAGELYYPFDFAVAESDGRIVVHDQGNKRIASWDAEGSYIGAFPARPKALGLAVDKRGHIYLGQPAAGSLISVYNQAGDLERRFGELVTASGVLGEEYQQYDERYRIPMNRARFAFDGEGNLWAAYLHLPHIAKFAPDGRRLFAHTLDVAGIEALRDAVWQQPPPGHLASLNYDGVQLTLVQKDLAFHRGAGEMLLLLGDDRILRLGADGGVRGAYESAPPKSLQTLDVAADGTVHASVLFSKRVFSLGKLRSIEADDHESVDVE